MEQYQYIQRKLNEFQQSQLEQIYKQYGLEKIRHKLKLKSIACDQVEYECLINSQKLDRINSLIASQEKVIQRICKPIQQKYHTLQKISLHPSLASSHLNHDVIQICNVKFGIEFNGHDICKLPEQVLYVIEEIRTHTAHLQVEFQSKILDSNYNTQKLLELGFLGFQLSIDDKVRLDDIKLIIKSDDLSRKAKIKIIDSLIDHDLAADLPDLDHMKYNHNLCNIEFYINNKLTLGLLLQYMIDEDTVVHYQKEEEINEIYKGFIMPSTYAISSDCKAPNPKALRQIDAGHTLQSLQYTKIYRDLSTGYQWYLKKVDEKHMFSSGIIELFGSFASKNYLSDSLPDNLILCNTVVKLHSGNYAASRQLEGFKTLTKIKDENEFLKSPVLTMAAAFAMFIGQTTNAEYNNIGVSKFNNQNYVINIDFQNFVILSDTIPTKFENSDCSNFDNYRFGKAQFDTNSLQLELLNLSRTTFDIQGLHDKFSEFDWYFVENNIDINAELLKYHNFIESRKGCVENLYNHEFEI